MPATYLRNTRRQRARGRPARRNGRSSRRVRPGNRVRGRRLAARSRRPRVKRSIRAIVNKVMTTNMANKQNYITSCCDVAVANGPYVGGTQSQPAADVIGQTSLYFTVGTTPNGVSGTTDARPMLDMHDVIRMGDTIRTDNTGTFTAGGTVLPQDLLGETKFYVESCYQNYQLTNQCNSVITLYMYTCQIRRDIINGQSCYNITNLLTQGWSQRDFIVNPKTTGNPPGDAPADLTPFDSHKFCSFVKILKTEKVLMDPGTQVNRTIRASDKIINFDHYFTYTSLAGSQTTESRSQDYSHRAGAMFILFRMIGQPSVRQQTVNSVTTGTQLGAYTVPKIAMITKTHYTFQSISRQSPKGIREVAQGFYDPYMATDGGEIINDENGQVTGGQQA